MTERVRVPRDLSNDYTEEMAAARRRFVAEHTGAVLDHVGHYSIDPAHVSGNGENFFGVAQVPIGVAGPLRIDGEYASGEFLVPLATTEGTLIASYSRGMRLLTESGGVRTAVVEDYMQRAPRSYAATPSPHATSAVGSMSTSTRSRRRPSRPPASVSSRTSANTRSARFGTSGSITQPGTPPGRT